MGDVWSRLADVAAHFTHDTYMFIAIEQRVFLISCTMSAPSKSLVGLEAGVGENDDESLGIAVRSGDGRVLLGNELRQLGWRKGLGS